MYNISKILLQFSILTLLLKCSKCNNNEDTIDSIVKKYGYQMQNYTAQTDDGFILQLFRISQKGSQNITGTPMVIWHAFERNAKCFVLNGKQSVAFYYVNAGYDVWLPNMRGTKFSSHVTLKSSEPEFWDFSYGKIGKYDIKSVTELIVKTTGQKVISVAHTLGTSALFVYASEYPEDASKNMKGIIAYAPSVNLYKTKVIYLQLLSKVPDLVRAFFDTLKIKYVDTSIQSLCQYGILQPACTLLINSLIGKSDNINMKYFLPMFTATGSEPISSLVFINYLQMINQKGHFADYSYGAVRNLQKYGKEPPTFNLKNIKIRVDLICGGNDYVSSCEDTKSTFNMLQTEKSYTVLPNNTKCQGDVAHLDMFICTNMEHCVFEPISNILTNY